MNLVARGAALLVVVLTVAHLLWIYQGLRSSRDGMKVRESLRRLSALTIRNFPERNLDSPDTFWKAIGREGNPMLDSWGTEYRVSSREEKKQRIYSWASAGPDRNFGTPDDIVVDIPYPSGPLSSPDLAPGESAVPQPVSLDAR